MVITGDLCWIERAKNGAVEIAKLLLDAGANPVQCLATAVQCGREEIVDLLLEVGDESDGWNRTPLFFYNSDTCEIARKLVKAGADIDHVSWDIWNIEQQRRDSQTLLHFAVRAYAKGLFLTLLACGASPHAHDSAGRSVFLLAALGNRVDLARLLLAVGYKPVDADFVGLEAGNRGLWLGLANDTDRISHTRTLIAREHHDWIRPRVVEIVMGLQSLRISALELCAIVMADARGFALYIPFGIVWKLVVFVKHFNRERE